MSKTYTVKQVAEALGFSTNTVYKYLDQGKIKATRLGLEGRFRIPEEELVRLLGMKSGSTSPAIPNSVTVNTPNLFDWFVAILAIFVGISIFLLPALYLDRGLAPFGEHLKYSKFGLIIFGLALIGVDIFKTDRRLWHIILHLILGLLFALLAFIAYQTNYLPRALSMGSISFILLTTTYFKISERLRFVVFIDMLAFFAGWIFLNYPQTIGFQPLSDWILNNQVIFGVVWYTLIPLVILVSILSLRRGRIWGGIFAVAVSVGAFGYALVNLSTGRWTDTVYNIVLGSFALIFPFWRRFNEFARSSQKELLASFGWVVVVFLIGLALTVYLQESFKGLVKSESRRSVQLAVKMVEDYIDESQKIVIAFSDNQELIRLMGEESINTAVLNERIKNFYLSSTTLRRIVVIDETGKGTAIYPDDSSFPGQDLSFRDYFQKSKQYRRVVISETVVPVVSGVPVAVVVAAPILDQDGQFLGVIGGSLDFVKLGAKLGIDSSGSGKTFIMADNKQQIIVHPDSTRLLESVPENSALGLALTGQMGQVETFGEDNGRLLQTYAPIRGVGWGIVIEQPLTEVLKHQSIIVFNVFLVTIISGIGSLLAVIYLRRT